MSFGAIRSGYEEVHYSYAAQSRTSAGDFTTEKTFMLPENGTSPEILGIGFLDAGGGVSYGMSAFYAENSTAENPIVKVSVRKSANSVETYEININEIDASNATEMEMFALCNYADDIGKGTGSTFGSWQTLKNFGYNAECLGDFSLSGNMQDFVSAKKDWSKMVESMTTVYMEAGVYKQVLDCKCLAHIFDLCAHKSTKS